MDVRRRRRRVTHDCMITSWGIRQWLSGLTTRELPRTHGGSSPPEKMPARPEKRTREGCSDFGRCTSCHREEGAEH